MKDDSLNLSLSLSLGLCLGCSKLSFAVIIRNMYKYVYI